MVSIIFFLLIGVSQSIEKYEALTKEVKQEVVAGIKNDSLKKKKERLTQAEIDSLKENLNEGLKKSYIPKIARDKILKQVDDRAKDTISENGIDANFDFGNKRLEDFTSYVKKYPNSKIDVALEALGYQKNFTNRFLYTKTKRLNSVAKSKESRDQFFNEVLSYGSIALFVFLPFFTLFLKLFYIRRNYTYVDHLVFVFHVQTVFFMLFSFFVLLKIFGVNLSIILFLLLFLVYLIIAMKNFYVQGYLKTFLKFILLNISYLFVGGIGVVLVFVISFALF
jgi:hypothetical protein